jgi:hypothetical protein
MQQLGQIGLGLLFRAVTPSPTAVKTGSRLLLQINAEFAITNWAMHAHIDDDGRKVRKMAWYEVKECLEAECYVRKYSAYIIHGEEVGFNFYPS